MNKNSFIYHFLNKRRLVSKAMLAWLFPYYCVFCKQPSNRAIALCQYCEHQLPELNNPCQRCGQACNQPLSMNLCGRCMVAPPTYERLFALYPYEEPISHLITALKFGHRLLYARLFSELFIQKMPLWYPYSKLPEAILPVPLHPKRLKQRGFNQSLEIARIIAKQFNIPLLTHSVARIKPTLAQSELPAQQRYANVKNAFRVHQPIDQKNIVILDDVVTTGHTVDQLALVLKQQGITKIEVWCCARAQGH